MKFAAENPGSPLFAHDVVSRLPALKSGRFWKEQHDLSLLRAVLKYVPCFIWLFLFFWPRKIIIYSIAFLVDNHEP